MQRVLTAFSVPALAIIVGSCVGAAGQPRHVQGSCGEVHGGQVCTFATLTGRDDVVEVGATISLAAIERAPADAEMKWPPQANAVLQLPAEAAAATGLQLLTVFWEPHGHPPGPYLTPHFDFHFYNIAKTGVDAIDCKDLRKPATLATGYILPDEDIPGLGKLVGICVPNMGMHSLSEREFTSTETFSGTMVLGYYQEAPIFIEPMIAKAKLMERKTFELEIPAGAGGGTVKYPERFRAEYDAGTDSYRFVFSGFARVAAN
jgi:hypothetical protein